MVTESQKESEFPYVGPVKHNSATIFQLSKFFLFQAIQAKRRFISALVVINLTVSRCFSYLFHISNRPCPLISSENEEVTRTGKKVIALSLIPLGKLFTAKIVTWAINKKDRQKDKHSAKK